MEKKQYVEPIIEIVKLDDIITASGPLQQKPWDPNSQDDPFDIDLFK